MQQRDGSLGTEARSNHTLRSGLVRWMEKGRGIMYLVGVSCIEFNISCFSHFRLYRINLSYCIKSVMTVIMQ